MNCHRPSVAVCAIQVILGTVLFGAFAIIVLAVF